MNSIVEDIERAAGDGELMRAVGELYAEVGTAIDQLAVGCEQCGRCCRFEEFGQDLLVSTVEAGYLLSWLRRHWSGLRRQLGERVKVGQEVCPFLEGKVCGMREGRALGCRVFFCRAKGAKRTEMEEIYEVYHKRIRELHEQRGLSYGYFPWSKAVSAAADVLDLYEPRAENTYSYRG